MWRTVAAALDWQEGSSYPLGRKQCPAFPQLLPRSTLRVRSAHTPEGDQDGKRNREVVQRRQGLWLHRARRRRQGPLRASQRDPGQRIQVADRGREGELRR